MVLDWEKLPRKTLSAPALFLNNAGQILILKPTYREGWNLPGGFIELDESPSEGCRREVIEEIGLAKDFNQLACVMYVKKARNGKETFRFIFWGGVLTAEEIKNIKLQTEEISEFKFIDPKEADAYFGPRFNQLIEPAIQAARENRILYLEL